MKRDIKTNQMNRQTIIQILNGYENQLANAQIANDKKQIEWLTTQITEGHRVLATMATGYSN